jgi:uncharacterized membrane protein
MNVILDPVWPWSRLWEVLLQLPPAIQFAAGVAALLAVVVPVLHFLPQGITAAMRSKRRRVLLTAASTLALSLILLVRHTWAFAWNDAHLAAGSGLTAWFLSFLVQLNYVLLLIGPGSLAGVSVGTYLGTPGVSRGRLAVVVSLRLLAFVVAIIALARPALAAPERDRASSVLYIVPDASKSMTINDEVADRTRWELLKHTLESCRVPLERLEKEHDVEVRWFRFADGVSDFDPANTGEADGMRTDFGVMLRDLFERREPRRRIRGLLVISDGADNGTAIPALSEAARWRSVPCPIHTFACGKPNMPRKHKDVAITSISTSPAPFVPVKGKLTVKVTIDAHGYEGSKAHVRLFLEGEDEKGVVTDREMPVAQDVRLMLKEGNEVTLTCDAPAKPGEVKVKVVVETPDRDLITQNNTIETFVTVSKEGISVLLVDRARAFEPQFICDALAGDQRIRVTPVWVRGGKPVAVGAGKPTLLDDQPYDVIILGDVTAAQVRAIQPDALKKIEKLVARGSGLMMLGGYFSLGNSDWKGSELEPMLPVDLSESRGQEERETQMVPTEKGLRLAPYILRLDENPDLKEAWKKLAKLDGRSVIKRLDPAPATEGVLAETDDGQPLLVMQQYAGLRDAKGKPAGPLARVLVFGGDTTHRWVRDEAGQRLHARFWKQVVVWLAKQEDAAGSVWVRPDVRRLPVRSELGFQVGLRGKGGGPDLRSGKYEVEVIDPAGNKSKVNVVQGRTENRGTFAATQAPGIYKIVVRGSGKDPAGEEVSGESSSRVIVFDEDVEMLRPAADPEFLKKLSAAGGGEALRVEQLADFLNRLAEQRTDAGKPKMLLRPDWRSTGRSGFLVVFFVVFCMLVSAEWGFRRWWGMV